MFFMGEDVVISATKYIHPVIFFIKKGVSRFSRLNIS